MALNLKRLEKILDKQLKGETYSSLMKWMKEKGLADPHLGNSNFGFKKGDFKWKY